MGASRGRRPRDRAGRLGSYAADAPPFSESLKGEGFSGHRERAHVIAAGGPLFCQPQKGGRDARTQRIACARDNAAGLPLPMPRPERAGYRKMLHVK